MTDRIPFPKPTLTFVAGGPATGKTFLLNELVPLMDRSLLVDKDAIGDTFMRGPDTGVDGEKYNIRWWRLGEQEHDIASEFYRDNIGMQTYGSMLELAATNLELELSPFLQGNYTSPLGQGYMQEVVEPFLQERGLQVPVKLIVCQVDPKTMADRIRERNDPRDAPKLVSRAAMQKYLDSQQPAYERLDKALEGMDHLRLDGTAPLYSVRPGDGKDDVGGDEGNVMKAVEYLRE